MTLEYELAQATAWADATFTNATQESRAAHLYREAKELLDNPNDAEEMADVAMLLGHLALHAGVDLASAVHEKLMKNRLRKWGKPDHEGVCEHVE